LTQVGRLLKCIGEVRGSNTGRDASYIIFLLIFSQSLVECVGVVHALLQIYFGSNILNSSSTNNVSIWPYLFSDRVCVLNQSLIKRYSWRVFFWKACLFTCFYSLFKDYVSNLNFLVLYKNFLSQECCFSFKLILFATNKIKLVNETETSFCLKCLGLG
jgi:hypothetical protein